MRLLAILLVLSSVGCDFTAEQRGSENRLEDLIDRFWELEVFFDERGLPVGLQGDERYSIMFERDGQFGGRMDCNDYFGTYQAQSNGKLSIDGKKIGSTLALCRNGGQSGIFMEALISVSRFDIDESTLVLSFEGRGRLVFYEQASSIVD